MMSQLFDMLYRLFVSSLIVVSLFWMVFWDCNRRNPFHRHFITKIKRPFLWLGLTGKWRMFSPDPPRHDVWPVAVLTMADDSVLSWEPKPYAAMSVLEKLRFKKLLKFYYQVLAPRASNQIKRDFVEHVLRRERSGKTCTKIEVLRVSREVVPFGEKNASRRKEGREPIYVFYPNPKPQPKSTEQPW